MHPIPWPRVLKGGKAALIFCEGLFEAVKIESEKERAIDHATP